MSTTKPGTVSLIDQLREARKDSGRSAATAMGGRLSPFSSDHVFDKKGPDREAMRSPVRSDEFGLDFMQMNTAGQAPLVAPTMPDLAVEMPQSLAQSFKPPPAATAQRTEHKETPQYNAGAMYDSIMSMTYLPASERARMTALVNDTTQDGQITEAYFRAQFLARKPGDPYFSKATPADKQSLCSHIQPYLKRDATIWNTILCWIIRLYLDKSWIVWMIDNRPESHTSHLPGIVLREAAKSPLYRYATDKEKTLSLKLKWNPSLYKYGFTLIDVPPPELKPDYLEHIISTYISTIAERETRPWPTKSIFALALLRPSDALAEQIIATAHHQTFGSESERIKMLHATDSKGDNLLTVCAKEHNVPLTKYLIAQGVNVLSGVLTPQTNAVLIWASWYRELEELYNRQMETSLIPQALVRLEDTEVEANIALTMLNDLLRTALGVLVPFRQASGSDEKGEGVEDAFTDLESNPDRIDELSNFFGAFRDTLGPYTYEKFMEIIMNDGSASNAQQDEEFDLPAEASSSGENDGTNSIFTDPTGISVATGGGDDDDGEEGEGDGQNIWEVADEPTLHAASSSKQPQQPPTFDDIFSLTPITTATSNVQSSSRTSSLQNGNMSK